MKLTNRELTVMKILWESDKPLMVSEIVKKDPHGTIYSVQRIIQNLIKKNMVAVDGVSYNKKALGRTFKPLVSSEAVEINNIKEMLSNMVSKNIAASSLIAALLPTNNDKQTLAELDNLEKIIQERKNTILNDSVSEKPPEN